MDDQAIELEALESIMSDATAEPMKLSYGLIVSITDNFSTEIGRGGFGVVYKGVLQNGDVAVKKLMNLHTLTEKQYLDEITCLKKAKHKNVVRFLGYCSEAQGKLFEINGANVMAEDQQKLLCFEYVSNGNIKHYLQKEKSHGDNWPLRYQMIRGICQGLYYLHGEHITHLDLKPDNVMLDNHMEPKITDFGIARCLDQGQSKIITQNILGTLRYIAPETIDSGEISFKSDIYALGIIIIELLTGIDKVELDNWEESLDGMDCPRVRRCTEIARKCTDRDRHNRPTIAELISDLDDLERMLPQASINQQVAPTTTVRWTELVDVSPLKLNFPFVPNQEMHCQLALTNKTNSGAIFVIRSEYPERYQWGEIGCKEDRGGYHFLPPELTKTMTVYRQAVEELPPYTDRLEINVLFTGLDCDDTLKKLSTVSLPDCTTMDDAIVVAGQRLGFELHVEELTAVVVSEEDDRAVVAHTTFWEEGDFHFDYMDVHPTEPWVLIVGFARDSLVYIWNFETNKKIGEFKTPAGYEYRNKVARFIARKKWVAVGDWDGSILVRMCPTLHHVKQFKAHPMDVTLLAVHPTRPFLLSASNPLTLRLWDWSRNWSCTRIFEVAVPVRQVMFDPEHATTFATMHQAGPGVLTLWSIGHPDPVETTYLCESDRDGTFTYIGERHCVALAEGLDVLILDLQKDKHVVEPIFFKNVVHTIRIVQEVVAMICHPTRPILVTVLLDGYILVWDSLTYRLKRTYVNPRKDPLHIGFTGSTRLVIGNKEGITVMDVDLE